MKKITLGSITCTKSKILVHHTSVRSGVVLHIHTMRVESRAPENTRVPPAIGPRMAFLFFLCTWEPCKEFIWIHGYLRRESVVLGSFWICCAVCFFSSFFFYAGLYPMKSPSFTLIAVGNMWSLIKNIFSVEIAFISWANFSWPSTHQSFFGKGNSSLWVSKCQATEQNEREGEGGKNNSQVCCKAFVQKVLEGFLFSP